MTDLEGRTQFVLAGGFGGRHPAVGLYRMAFRALVTCLGHFGLKGAT